MSAVLTEQRGGVLIVTINRPEARNAIDATAARGLCAAMAQLDQDPALRAGVITGAGRWFSAGMDLKGFLAHGLAPEFGEFLAQGSRKPLIAAIEGLALAGGLEVALTCDILVAARDAVVGIPEAGLGLFAAGGALLRLPRRVPYGLAMELALTGDSMDAERAAAAGLLDRLTEPGQALDVALALAERIACNAPLALEASKHVLQAGGGRVESDFWAFQKPVIDELFATDDAREGPTAFAEKRPPAWTGT